MQQRQAHQIILHKIPCGSKEVGEVKQKIWSSPKTSIKKKGSYRVLDKATYIPYWIQRLPFCEGIGRPGIKVNK